MNIDLIQVMIQYYVFAQIIPSLATGSFWVDSSVPLTYSYQYVCLFIQVDGSGYLLNFLAPQNSPGSSHMFPAPVPESPFL